MKKIANILIKNFQKHKLLRLDFEPGVNAIAGISDSGKTSVMRAIRWAITNRPVGDYYIHHGKKFCSVRLEFFDGTWLKHFKSKQKNKLIIFNGKEKTEFENFGMNVPPEIDRFLGINSLHKKDIFLFPQKAERFLIEQTPENRWNWFAEMTGMGKAIGIRKDLRADIRQAQTEVGILNEDKKEIEQKLKSDFYDKIEYRWSKVNDRYDKLIKLQKVLEKYCDYDRRLSSAKIVLRETSKKWADFIDKADKLDNYLNKYESIVDKLGEYRQHKSKLEYWRNELDFSSIPEGLNIDEFDDILEELEAASNDLSTLVKIKNRLNKLRERKKSYEEEQTTTANKLKEAERAYDELKKQLGICPTCGQKFE